MFIKMIQNILPFTINGGSFFCASSAESVGRLLIISPRA